MEVIVSRALGTGMGLLVATNIAVVVALCTLPCHFIGVIFKVPGWTILGTGRVGIQIEGVLTRLAALWITLFTVEIYALALYTKICIGVHLMSWLAGVALDF